MPKLNFNTPFMNEEGKAVMKLRTDDSRIKVDPQTGNATPHVETDENGVAIQDPTMIKDMLVKILTRGYVGDDQKPFEEKAARGKLARKIANNSTVHYTYKEIGIIKEFAARAGSTTLITQLGDIIDGKSDDAAGEVETDEKTAA